MLKPAVTTLIPTPILEEENLIRPVLRVQALPYTWTWPL